MEVQSVKCRKCRNLLLEPSNLISCRGETLKSVYSADETSSGCTSTLLFVDPENPPTWVEDAIFQENWLKGKLLCPKCSARIGAFDFTTSVTCECKGHQLPNIKALRSKVDMVTSNLPLLKQKHDSSTERPATTNAALMTYYHQPSDFIDGTGCGMEDLPLDDNMKRVDVAPSSLDQRKLRKRPDKEEQPKCHQSSTKKQCYCVTAGCSCVSSSSPLACEAANTASKAVDRSVIETRSSSTNINEGHPLHNCFCQSSIVRNSSQNCSCEKNNGCQMGRGCNINSSDNSVATEQEPLVTDDNKYKVLRDQEESTIQKDGDEDEWLDADAEENQEGYCCPICLEVFFQPHQLRPCGHLFCAPCLRSLCTNQPTNTKCPLCRKLISFCLPDHEMCQLVKEKFPEEYKERRRLSKKAGKAAGRGRLPGSRHGFGGQTRGSKVLAKYAAACFIVLLLLTSATVLFTVASMAIFMIFESALDLLLTFDQMVDHLWEISSYGLMGGSYEDMERSASVIADESSKKIFKSLHKMREAMSGVAEVKDSPLLLLCMNVIKYFVFTFVIYHAMRYVRQRVWRIAR